MSYTITTDIFCENCSVWDPNCGVSGTNQIEVREARRKTKSRGWKMILMDERMVDLCPECSKEYADNNRFKADAKSRTA